MTDSLEEPEEGEHLTEEDLDRALEDEKGPSEIPSLHCNKEDCHVATNEFDTSPHPEDED